MEYLVPFSSFYIFEADIAGRKGRWLHVALAKAQSFDGSMQYYSLYRVILLVMIMNMEVFVYT